MWSEERLAEAAGVEAPDHHLGRYVLQVGDPHLVPLKVIIQLLSHWLLSSQVQLLGNRTTGPSSSITVLLKTIVYLSACRVDSITIDFCLNGF